MHVRNVAVDNGGMGEKGMIRDVSSAVMVNRYTWHPFSQAEILRAKGFRDMLYPRRKKERTSSCELAQRDPSAACMVFKMKAPAGHDTL